jgi:hypothetical protein
MLKLKAKVADAQTELLWNRNLTASVQSVPGAELRAVAAHPLVGAPPVHFLKDPFEIPVEF